MTKAERRELQEKQRAAKAAAKAQGGTTGSAGGSAKPKAGTGGAGGSQSQVKKAEPAKQPIGGGVSMSRGADQSGGQQGDDAGGKRGPRIFTHFGLPKPIGHTLKGDIHPAVVRLGISFSEFKICGANARCIATLTAFKNVSRKAFLPNALRLWRSTAKFKCGFRSYKTIPHPLTIPSPATL
jgi:translation initiation factor eIF-2B subunit delta